MVCLIVLLLTFLVRVWGLVLASCWLVWFCVLVACGLWFATRLYGCWGGCGFYFVGFVWYCVWFDRLCCLDVCCLCLCCLLGDLIVVMVVDDLIM